MDRSGGSYRVDRQTGAPVEDPPDLKNKEKRFSLIPIFASLTISKYKPPDSDYF